MTSIDDYIAQVMQDWQVPGLAIAIIHKGSILLTKGYGYRNLEQKLPVTEQTLFPIASVTKSFTATSLAMLVNEGNLEWDEPVYKLLSDFKLNNEFVTKNITLRDLLTHRSGLPRHDVVWYSSNFTRAELMRRLRYLELNKQLREGFQYGNFAYVVAGYLAGLLFGSTWEELVRQRIWSPLNMHASNFSVIDTQKSDNFAFPYRKKNDAVHQVAFCNLEKIGPAGAINSTLENMVQYLLFHMNRGKIGKHSLLDDRIIAELYKPHIIVPDGIGGIPQFSEIGKINYGMGFVTHPYRGHTLVAHGGCIDGFCAELAFLPDDDIGIVILANLDGRNFHLGTLGYAIVDHLLGLEPIAWNQRLLQLVKNAEDDAQKKVENGNYALKKLGTLPSHKLEEYVGNYMHLGYGTIKITFDGTNLKLALNEWNTSLQYLHNNVFIVPENTLDPLQNQKFLFHTGLEGNVSSISAALEPTIKEITFMRVVNKKIFEEESQSNFVEH